MLIEASDAASRDHATYEAWGGSLAEPAYRAMVGRLRSQTWARAVSRTWLLQTDDQEVLCSCETFKMPSSLAGARGHCHAIASVYTEPRLRRRGHASELLNQLAAHIQASEPEAQALVLFSDVAPALYERVGFTVRPAISLVLPALPGTAGPHLLGEGEAAAVLAELPPPPGALVILPAPGQILWHWEQERILATMLGRPRPAGRGARLAGGAALWSADWAHDRLNLLLLTARDREAAAALLASAQGVAHGCGLARVALWTTPLDPAWPADPLQDRTGIRDSVPMVRPLDPRCAPADWCWIPRALWV